METDINRENLKKDLEQLSCDIKTIQTMFTFEQKLKDVTTELEYHTELRNIKSQSEHLHLLLTQVEIMIDAKEINATELISIVSEYKRIKELKQE